MTITIQAEKREGTGKNANRRLRKQGLVPAILYGEAVASVALTLKKKDIADIMKLETRENTLFRVGFGDDVRDAMIKDLQVDPATDELLHADLVQIAMDKMIRIAVPVVPKGEAYGVKNEGGFVDFITRELEIECLPKDIPDKIEIEVTDLHLHQSVKIENITPPQGVKFMTEPGTVLLMISLPHKEEEFPGEKPEAAAAEEAKEPEVIKKERATEEAEGEGAKGKGGEPAKGKGGEPGKGMGKEKEK